MGGVSMSLTNTICGDSTLSAYFTEEEKNEV